MNERRASPSEVTARPPPARPNESRAARFRPRPLAAGAAALALLTACVHTRETSRVASPVQRRGAVILIVKRSWHIDVGFTAREMGPALAPLKEALPRARYILVGFGDRHYLLSKGNRLTELIGAVFPGRGVLLVTGLEATPEAAFGADEVLEIDVPVPEEHALERFVASSLTQPSDGPAMPLAPGPYAGSVYFASSEHYSGLHTCNTWAAQALRAAGLPIESGGVVFAFQVWRQARRAAREAAREEHVGAPAD